ncbi:MAG: META domain-containing protein [Flavobacterium sp. JAD_PAG50586_2]|nr:MAG: META domain-containing protein [Flavobacterium sp. JAD_PAG50586_2]
MKKHILILLFPILILGCSATKTATNKTDLYAGTWELEYISGPRIAFEGLYPEQKPYITFNEAESQFGGNNSCNVYSGKYTLKDNTIHFGDAMKTMRYCEGGGEATFMDMLGKVNKFKIDSEGKLLLLIDDIPMMRFNFKKITKPQQ